MKIKIVTAILVLLYICPIYSQDISDEELERREHIAAKLNSDSNNLDRAYGYYMRVRDQYFYGSSGIETKTNEFFKDSLAWIDQWSRILVLIDLSGSTTLDQIIRRSQEAMDDQAKKLEELRETARQISSRGDAALRLLQQTKTLDHSILPQYREVVTAALSAISTLENSIQRSSHLAWQRIAEMERAHQLSYQASMGRLKMELIKSGKYPLEQSLSRFEDMLHVQDIAGPMIANLQAKENELDKYVLNMAYFQAKTAYATIQMDCQSAKASLSQLSSSFASHALTRVNQLCSAADSHWRSITSLGLSKADLVYEYTSFLGFTLDRECKQGNLAINCENLALLRSIKPSQLRAMSDDRLEFFESQWAELERAI